MALHRSWGLAFIACMATTPFPTLAQVEINSFDQPGVLEWSNALPAATTFDVEWIGALHEGAWHSSWSNLFDIPATGEPYRVEVPAFFRVLAHTNILRSQWTLFYYMMADNNLEPDFIEKFCDLTRWSSDTNVQLVVQFDRNGSDTRYGGWTGCERFYITNGILPLQDSAVQDWGDGKGGRSLNMADPSSLLDFLKWGMALYPAERYALVIGNHGFGWKGFGICDRYAESIMYISDLRVVLESLRTPIHCLLLDACNMHMAETIHELRNTGLEYVFGSETYGQTDWPYGWMIEGLQLNPQWSPREFVVDVNERLWDYYSSSTAVSSITLCTTDLSLVPALATNIELFAAGVTDTTIPFAEVQSRAQAVMNSILDAVIVRRLGPDWDNLAHGLAVYFPLKQDYMHVRQSFDEYTPRRTRFSYETGWRTMLNAFYFLEPCHAQLFDVRYAITNYTDPGGDENLDLYDFCRRFSEAAP